MPSRRSFLAGLASTLVASRSSASAVLAGLPRPRPSPAQLAWQRDELALFLHFGVNTFTDREWGDGREDPAIFAPTQLDARQWARSAREAGFRTLILTAKHHDGFCLWQTKTTKHSVGSSPWRGGGGDVVRELVDACRAEGLNAGLYLSPWDRHEPSYGDSPRYNDLYCDQLRELLPITGGRAFVLFTSLRNMRAVHELLAGELPWQTLLQGDAPKQQLLRKFRETPSVLFASQSFWEGVDVPGDALSLVVIDKLPFASPSEPITAARIDRLRSEGQDAFFSYQVPQAALALKQGFGRLIRTAADRGIVAVLDGRITRKGYGRLFIETLPRCRTLRSPAEARHFWDGTEPI